MHLEVGLSWHHLHANQLSKPPALQPQMCHALWAPHQHVAAHRKISCCSCNTTQHLIHWIRGECILALSSCGCRGRRGGTPAWLDQGGTKSNRLQSGGLPHPRPCLGTLIWQMHPCWTHHWSQQNMAPQQLHPGHRPLSLFPLPLSLLSSACCR